MDCLARVWWWWRRWWRQDAGTLRLHEKRQGSPDGAYGHVRSEAHGPTEGAAANPAPVEIPAKPLADAAQSLPGVLRLQTPTATQGPGLDGGAGAGTGTGSGEGRGSGLGPGFGGGTGGGAYRPGSGVTSPQLLREVKPNYTAAAMRAKVQGVVLLECVVGPDGSIGQVNIVKSLDKVFGLDDEAVKAAKQWRFDPGRRFGEPVAVGTSCLSWPLRFVDDIRRFSLLATAARCAPPRLPVHLTTPIHVCPCADGWRCAQHPEQPWPHDDCRRSNCRLMLSGDLQRTMTPDQWMRVNPRSCLWANPFTLRRAANDPRPCLTGAEAGHDVDGARVLLSAPPVGR